MKNTTYKLVHLCGFLVLMQGMIFCTKQDSSVSENEPLTDNPKIDGWELKAVDFNVDILSRKLLFVNPTSGYLIGYNGAIIHTPDSGKTWQTLNSGTTLHLTSIFFLNENTGFISGKGMSGCLDPDCNKGSIFLKTTDGGLHWNKIFYDSLAYPETMQFRDLKNGIAVMECTERPNMKHKFLVKTEDGGTTWSKTNIEIPQTTPANLINVQGIYYLIGANNKILKSIDFGNNWQSYSTPVSVPNDLQIMHFLNKDIGLISDGVSSYKTLNGGVTWQKINNQLPRFNGVHFYNDLEGFGFEIVSAYEGGDFPTFKGTYIYSTNDGGINWRRSGLYSKFVINKMSFPSSEIGYVISGSLLYKFSRK